MKKNLLVFTSFLFFLLLGLTARAQTWTIYDGSVLPDAATPAWEAGDVGSIPVPYSIVDEAGNKVLYETSSSTDTNEKKSWKLKTTQPLSATWLFRVKAGNNPSSPEFEINTKLGTQAYRVNLKLLTDAAGGYISLNYINETLKTYPADKSLNVKAYHTIRITVENAINLKVYLDENATPVLTGTLATSTQSQFLRFGDVGTTQTEGYVDWMAWDATGVYAPGTTLPAGVIVDGASAPTVPAAPNATAATGITSTGFTANWDAAATATGYKLDVATDNAFTSMVTGFNDKDVANVTTFNVTGLTAGTTYYYRLRAYNAAGTSAASSNVITASTTSGTVAVTGITVTGAGGATTITTNAGTLQMSAAVAPENASNKEVTWSVTNGTGEATISTSGLLTAVKNGTVTVKATAKDGSNVFGTLDITISGQNIAVTGITVTGAGNATTITTNGGTLQMSAAVAPADATNKEVTWSVTNGTGQASISTTGLLTAAKNGTVTVKATAKDGSNVFGTLDITISGQNVAVTGITVTGAGNATTITTNGGTLQMNAAVAPAEATNKEVTWSVTNGTGQASISTTGLLTAAKNGTVTVKATAKDGSNVFGTLDITISGQTVAVTGITVTGAGNATTITTNGGTLQMSVTVAPADATNKNVTWSISSGSDKATISTTGLLTASKNGTVTVKATASDGSNVFGTLDITISGQGTGVSEIRNNKPMVYPSPADNELKMDNASGVTRIEVIALNGKVLIQQTNLDESIKVDVSKLSSGVYIFKVYTVRGSEEVKFLKK